MNAAVSLIGIGNPQRGDDGVGWAFVDHVADTLPPGAMAHKIPGDATALLEAFQHSPCIWVIDAVHSGAPPGTLHWLDAHTGPLPAEWFSSVSTHDFGLAEAVELARTLDQLPPALHILGIEGSNFEPGTTLSVPVRQALPAAIVQWREKLHLQAPHA
jgi:hydrogenase maturation protease